MNDPVRGERRARAALASAPAAAAAAAAGGALAFLVVAPPYSSADEAAHVDYALQLWRGVLPVFEDGLQLRVEQGVVPPVQWTAQHPPAFYALLAPVVGPLVDASRPVAAAFAGRVVTLVLAVLTVLAASWASRWLLPARWQHLRWAVPVLVASSTWVLRLGGAVYNDVLLVLVVTLALGAVARRVRTGPPPAWWWAVWVVLPAAAALTRLSGVTLVLLCVGVVALDVLLRRRRSVRAWLGEVLAPLVVAVVASGWFYARNVRLTGSVTGGHPDWAAEHLGRQDASLAEVLTSGDFWRGSLQQYAAAPELRIPGNLVLFWLPAVVGLVAWVVLAARRDGATGDRLCLVLVAGGVGGLLLQQALYTTTGGGVNGRYLAVLALPFALLLVAALGAWPARAAVLVGAWFLLRAAELGIDLQTTFERYQVVPMPHLPPWLGWVGYAVFVAAGLAAVALGARATRRSVGDGLERGVEVQRAL